MQVRVLQTLSTRMLHFSTILIKVTAQSGFLHPTPLRAHQVSFTSMRPMNSDTKARFFGLIGLGSIAVWLTLSLGNAFYLCLISTHWPKAPVRVISSGVNTGSSTLGTWWEPDVEYQYRVSQHSYHSSTIRYLMPPFYEKEEAQTVLTAYPSEAQTTAAYDPEDPARSVLEPGVPPSMWKKALIPLFFWALTAYMFYEIVHPRRRLMLRPNPEVVAQE